MMRALYTASSGMVAQQTNTDVIANNISNVSTTGYKTSRVHFKDLLYQTVRLAGSPATADTVRPLPISVGNGTEVSATQLVFTQGALQETQVLTDLAIDGRGFFRVLLSNGSFGYTRDGSWQIDAQGQMVTSNGQRLLPNIVLPEGASPSTLTVSSQGLVEVELQGQPVEIGQIQLYYFPNPGGLTAQGDSIFLPSVASGEALGNLPGAGGLGLLRAGFLESSNTSVSQEIVRMIVAQRAYEINSKAIQTSDTMLGIAANLKRT